MAQPAPPQPTWLYRLVHVDCLSTLLTRGALHSPNHKPDDDLPYTTIHNVQVQANRHLKVVPCGPGGTVHDYLPFYFGPLSVMLLNLKTGRVADYNEGQAPLVYLLTTAQDVAAAQRPFVFSDGHGLARFTSWYDDLAALPAVDWSIVGARYWSDTAEDNDRKRRKQAEFLVHERLDWSTLRGIAVLGDATKTRVEAVLRQFPFRKQLPVVLKPGWYY